MNDSLVRAATTASSLEAEQDSGNINKTEFKATPNESSSQRTDSSGGPSNEDSLKLKELMELCTTLQSRVLYLEQTKATQANEIDSLKRRVKKIEKKQRLRTHKLKTLYKVGLTARVESSNDNEDLGEDAFEQERISDIDADEGITLVSTHDDAEVFDVDQDLDGKEVFVTKQDENVVEKEIDAAQVQVTTTATTLTISIDEATLAQALAKLKHAKPKAKAKGIVFHEPKESTTAAIPKPKSQDNGKAKMIEEPVKLKKKDQIMLNEEVALKLLAKFDKEQRLSREKAYKEIKEANIALIESWDDVQAKINADYQLAERLQAEEQQELNNKEKAILFMQLLKKRRKLFAAKRAEEKRNKPPAQAQKKLCSFQRVNTFVDFRTELVEESSKKAKAEAMNGSSKRAGTKLEQESSKKQKIDDDKETTELKQLVKIIPDEEGIAIDAIPLAVKPLSIVDWKIQKKGKEKLL
nr:hypothetical protein [Tanacetum cinerariifolium]